MHGLIGSTGFVGSTLLGQHSFAKTYDSVSIASITGLSFELLVCAGAPGQKWKANQDPDDDWERLQRLMHSLSTVEARQVVLLSTIDVFAKPDAVSEYDAPSLSTLGPYGRHRLLLEAYVQERFPRVTIVRLPGLYGTRLRKNLIYDIIHQRPTDGVPRNSRFQWYPMARLWADIEQAMRHQLPLVHCATEPMTVAELGLAVGHVIGGPEQAQAADYNFISNHASLFGGKPPYFLDQTWLRDDIGRFVADMKRTRA